MCRIRQARGAIATVPSARRIGVADDVEPVLGPALAVLLMPGGDLVVDLAHADAVGPEEQAAAIAREAEAVQPHHIDIAGTIRLALFQDTARLIHR